MNNVFIDVTVLEPRMKHPTIFDAFDNTEEGNAVVIHNDHDPKPLYYQLLGERGNCFSWRYLSNGPEIWEVEIKKNIRAAETVGEIAAKDMRKAELLKKMGIDFCCGGKRSLEEACIEKGLDVIRVKNELEGAEKQSAGVQLDFNSFSMSFLADYIVNIHHSFVKNNLPVITDLSLKVADHHGNNLPFLKRLYEQVDTLSKELIRHLKREEQVLFPLIKVLDGGGNIKVGFATISEPVYIMVRDHDIAGDILKEIRLLTNDYAVPTDACNSIKMLYHKLQEFENDLFQHIHLENNILFPKAIEAEKKANSDEGDQCKY
jgi:regulator of cell morphogenesis and NO signaling